MPYSAYVLDKESRELLLERFSPQFPEVIAHHITHQFPDDQPPPPRALLEVVGHASDERLECLVVELDGLSERPSGGIYHITLSLDREQGAKPVHSNEVLREGWTPLINPIQISAQPQLLGVFEKSRRERAKNKDQGDV